jgi:hypothetical protein
MRELSRLPFQTFLSVVSRALGWLIATLFRRRALISMERARGVMSRSCEAESRQEPQRRKGTMSADFETSGTRARAASSSTASLM